MRTLGERAVEITVSGTLPTTVQSAYTTTYTVFGNGEIKVFSIGRNRYLAAP